MPVRSRLSQICDAVRQATRDAIRSPRTSVRAASAAPRRVESVAPRRGGDARPARSGRMAVLAAAPKADRSANPLAAPSAWSIEAARRRAGAASRQPRQPDHHPERFVHRLGVAEYSRHIGVERDGAVARGRPQALAERRVASRLRARRALGTLVRIGSIEIAGRRSRCAEFAVHRRARARTAAGARGRIAINTRSLPRFLSSNRFINVPMPLSSGRAIHAAGSCRHSSSASPNGTRCTSASCSRLNALCKTRQHLSRSAPRPS